MNIKQRRSHLYLVGAAEFEGCAIDESHPTGFYIKLNVWGSLGLNFEYDGGPIIEIGGPIILYKLRILEGSTSFREGSV